MNSHLNYNAYSLHRGYVALMSALILSAMLMVLTFAANYDAFIARANLSHAEDHVQARHYANSCGSISLDILASDPERLETSTPLTVHLSDTTSCEILSGSVTGNSAEGTTRAHSGHSLSTLYIRASRASSTAPFMPTYWSEIPSE